jgi:hypothetical protein
MDIVYIETTVVGNIAGRIHPNPQVVHHDNALPVNGGGQRRFDIESSHLS